MLVAACGGGGASAPNTVVGSSGFAVDDYLRGATVLCDANGNGQFDTGETQITTDSSGFFNFTSACSATLVVTGGTNLDTGLPFTGKLQAPPGATFVTPLTTLMVGGMTLDQINAALGLPSGTDVRTLDPARKIGGVLVNPDLFRKTLAVQQLIQKTAETLANVAGAGGSAVLPTIYSEVAASMAASLRANPVLMSGTSMDQAAVESLVQAATQRVQSSAALSAEIRAGASAVNAASLAQVVAGAVVKQGNAILQSTGAAAITAMTRTVQGDSTIADFALLNKTAMAGAPSATTANLASTLTQQAPGGITPPPPPPPVSGTLLISWDESTLPATGIGAFGDGGPSVTAAPTGGGGNALRLDRSGTQLFGGTYFTVPAVPFAADRKTITARVYATRANAVVYLKVEVPGGQAVELPATVTAANTWQTLTWVLSGVSPASSYTTMVFSADTDVPNLGAQTYWIDDVVLANAPALTTCTTSTEQCISFSESTVAALGFEGLISAAVADDPVAGASNKVLKLVKGPSGQPWAGATVYTMGTVDPDPAVHSVLTIDPVGLNASKVVTVRSYSGAPVGTKVTLKLENGIDPGQNIAAETVTTLQNGWETLTFNFANLSTGVFSSTVTYNTASIFPAFSIPGAVVPLTADTNFYFDELKYAVATSGGGGSTAPTTAPTTTIPSGALTIYSEAAAVANFNPFPNWGQPTQFSEATIANNKSLKYTGLTYEGLDWSANPIDVSGKSKLHIDMWSPDMTAVKVSIISDGKENAVTQPLTAGSWNSFDIDLTNYTVPDKTAIIQIKLESTGAPGTLYVDNIYFWGSNAPASCGTTEPTCAPITAIPSGALTVYSEAAAVANFNPFPNWGQPTQFSEATLAGNKSLKYTGLTYEGLDWAANPIDVSGKGKLHLDMWSPDMTAVKVSIISANLENAVTQPLTPGSWNSIDIDLSSYTVPDKTAIIQIKLESTGAPGTLYVDNIYFWGTPSAGGSGTYNPNAVMGSGGAQTLVLSAGDSKGLFASGEAIFAVDYKGGLDSSNNFASYSEGRSDGIPGGGNIGYYNDPAMSTSAQKLEEGGWIVGTSLDPGGTPNFFRYFVMNGPASTFANAYMGLYANAPNNGTLDVSAYANLKFRLWGPAPMYEQANFNPPVEVVLSGPKVDGCGTGSGGTEITRTFTANQKIGAGSAYKLPLSGFTVKGVCGADTNGTAVASVLAKLARVSMTLPGSSLNFTNTNADNTTYSMGLNLGPIGFTNN